MKHLGDITKISGYEVEPVDIVCGGSPCQDLSVAGKRAGLAGERSGLFMEQIRIIKEMRENGKRTISNDNIRPRFMVWENVPGAFSSNNGEDFRAVLEETAKIADENATIPRPENGKWAPAGCIVGDGWSIAWRVHDAQYWGVPQRRKRICLLADFNGDSAGHILFELRRETVDGNAEQAVVDIGAQSQSEVSTITKGVSGNTAESREQGQSSATDVGSGVEETGRNVVAFEPGVASRCGGYVYENIAGTVRANAGDNQQTVVYGISAYESNSMKSGNPHSGIYKAETARTLDLNGGYPACNQGGMAVVCLEGNGSRPSHQGDGWHEGDPMYTLNSTEHHAVAIENHPKQTVYDWHRQDTRMTELGDVCVTAAAGWGGGGNNMPYVLEQGTYQETTGSLCASGYDKLGTQEAANDMYVVQSTMAMQAIGEYKESECALALKQRDYKDSTDLVCSFYPQMKAESQCFRDDNISNTLVNGTNPGYQNGICYGLDRAAYNQGQNAQYNFAVDEEKVGYQVAKGPGAVCTKGDNNAETRNQILRLLQETYGAETIFKWGVAVLDALQQANVLQQGVHESGISGEAENRQELDGGSPPCPSVVAGWLLRDMRQREECGCPPQGRKSSEQRFEQFDESMPELSQQNSQACKDLFDMWEKGEGLWLLREALSEIQKIRQSIDGQRQSVYGCAIVRRITPLEAERLQAFPDHWTDIGEWTDSKGKKHKDADSPRYKALGNSIALPFWEWMAKRMAAFIDTEHPTIGSLFDGISGFCLAFAKAGVRPVFSSEIEEFPIAVAKKHFGDDDLGLEGDYERYL